MPSSAFPRLVPDLCPAPDGSEVDFSQHGEQAFLLDYFSANPPVHGGRFLDVGAHDGEMFSNSRALALRGWAGVCVEGSPVPLAALVSRYAACADRVAVVGALLGVRGLVRFWDCGGDGVSSTVPAHVEKWSAAVAFRPCFLAGIDWPELLAPFGWPPFDLLSIDTEGESVGLLCSCPLLLSSSAPSVVVCEVECGLPEEVRASEFMRRCGYAAPVRLGANLVWTLPR